MSNAWLAEIIDNIRIEDLPESYQTVAEIIGKENTIKLARHLGGVPVYFPKLDTLIQRKRDERIRQEFNGVNHRDLARKYDLTERWIREIVQVPTSGNHDKPAPLQTLLF